MTNRTTSRLSAVIAIQIVATLCHGICQAETFSIDDAVVKFIDRIDVSVREQGVVADVLVTEGDLVEKDDVLVQMDDELLTIQRDVALVEAKIAKLDSENDVDLRFAKKSGAVSDAELARSEAALKDFPKSISRTELDQAKLVSERAKLQADQAIRDLDAKKLALQASCQQVKLAEKRIEMAQIKAPMAGLVTVLHKKPGEWANTGDKSAQVLRLDKLRIVAFVDGTRFDQSLRGAPATFTVKLPPGDKIATFTGRVSYVDPDISSIKDVQIRVDIDNPELTLRPGAVGKLEIDIDAQRENVTSTPTLQLTR